MSSADLIDEEIVSDRLTVVTDEFGGTKRLDKALADAVPDLSRSRLKTLIEAGAVLIDGVVATDPSRKVAAGTSVEIDMPPPEDPVPKGEDIPLDILFEDEHLIVINKPVGLVVHPGNGNWTGTLVNALIHHCGDTLSGIGGVKRPGIVHRLDKDTSGVMVVAKSDKAHAGLSRQFADHGRTGPLERAYYALVWGSPEPWRGTIDAPIGRSPTDRTRMAVLKNNGREAITHYEVVERYPASAGRDATAALVECHLETGRTHQIRVHMASQGHPLIGDQDYGKHFLTKANRMEEPLAGLVRGFHRQALHAFMIGFEHPITGDVMSFETDIPADLEALIEAFRAL